MVIQYTNILPTSSVRPINPGLQIIILTIIAAVQVASIFINNP